MATVNKIFFMVMMFFGVVTAGDDLFGGDWKSKMDSPDALSEQALTEALMMLENGINQEEFDQKNIASFVLGSKLCRLLHNLGDDLFWLEKFATPRKQAISELLGQLKGIWLKMLNAQKAMLFDRIDEADPGHKKEKELEAISSTAVLIGDLVRSVQTALTEIASGQLVGKKAKELIPSIVKQMHDELESEVDVFIEDSVDASFKSFTDSQKKEEIIKIEDNFEDDSFAVFASLVSLQAENLRRALKQLASQISDPISPADALRVSNSVAELAGTEMTANMESYLQGYLQSLKNIQTNSTKNPEIKPIVPATVIPSVPSQVPSNNKIVNPSDAARVLELIASGKKVL